MGIFSRTETNSTPSMAQPSSNTSNKVNMIAADATFEGVLRSSSDVRISGTLNGTLHVEGRVVVAEGGVVEGEIAAANIDVAGRVEGQLTASELLVLRASARVEGEVQAERLVIEEGAVFHGECLMGERAKKALSRQEGAAKTAAKTKDNASNDGRAKAKAQQSQAASS